jgi:hypothetical protein
MSQLVMINLDGLEIDDKLVRLVARNYNPLHYREKLTALLMSIFPAIDFKGWEKLKLHRLLNEVLLKKHSGEQILKYHLFHHFQKKNVIAAFEVKVRKSRLDFLAINGDSKSFEIKSGLDNLYKLKKQSEDYILVFDYNYLIVDEKHLDQALELAPSCFGVWSFSELGVRKNHRKAMPNHKIDAEAQMRLLTKKELLQQFKDLNGLTQDILRHYTENEINQRFKEALKLRYQRRWDFLLNHRDIILPVDIQFFFNKNIEPGIIYHE